MGTSERYWASRGKLWQRATNQISPLRLWPSLATLFVACCALAGCSDGRPARVPVSGQVLIDDKPLAFGFIQFSPAQGRPSGARLDREGRFSLSCFDQNDGAILGSHQVTVNGSEAVGTDQIRWHAPKKYSDPATSGLAEKISSPVNDLVIRLSWGSGKPFVEHVAPESEALPHSHGAKKPAQTGSKQ